MLYLYGVNKQISYITSAHLILLCVAASYFFISKISSASNNQDHVNLVDLSIPVKETVLSAKGVQGKTLFMSKCATCHNLFKIILGPPLAGVLERGPWKDRKQLYEWIRNPDGYMKKSAYTQELKKIYTIPMAPSPSLTDEEIDLIITYIKESEHPPAVQ